MPAPSAVDAQQVGGVELGLAEERVGALVGEARSARAGSRRGRRRQPAELLELGLALVAGEVLQHRAQVREVEQRQPAVSA